MRLYPLIPGADLSCTRPRGTTTMTTLNHDQLPTFMIIGAAKAGTTSLHHYLDLHPQIAMSSPKETNFFERSDAVEALAEYQQYFRPGTEVRGEASVHYTYFPTIDGIPERISAALPSLKLIYIVRDPVERAVAHYHERYQSNAAPRSIEAAFTDLEDPRKVWVWGSRYAVQVGRYLEHFPRSSLLILDDHNLRTRRLETLREVFSFLGVDPDFESPLFDEELNIRHGGRKRLTRPGQALRYSALANIVRDRVPPSLKERLFEGARRATSVEVRRREITPAGRARLEDALRADAQAFRELAGLRFEHWSV